MTTAIKICGITTARLARHCVQVGADFIGLVFCDRSPRVIDPKQGRAICQAAGQDVTTVGLFVDPAEEDVARIMDEVPLGALQFHGAESPAMLERVKARYDIPLIKAIPVSKPQDLASVKKYESVVDWFLFDARYNDGQMPGGQGRSFDWPVLKNLETERPWMLAGGLSPTTVEEALASVSPDGVDVSSGVETRPGHKSPALISEFIASVRKTG